MTQAVTPTTEAGIKRLATRIKKMTGVQHAVALDISARAGGYQNYAHFRKAAPGFSVAFPAERWKARAERDLPVIYGLPDTLDEAEKAVQMETAAMFREHGNDILSREAGYIGDVSGTRDYMSAIFQHALMLRVHGSFSETLKNFKFAYTISSEADKHGARATLMMLHLADGNLVEAQALTDKFPIDTSFGMMLGRAILEEISEDHDGASQKALQLLADWGGSLFRVMRDPDAEHDGPQNGGIVSSGNTEAILFMETCYDAIEMYAPVIDQIEQKVSRTETTLMLP